jgi:hypothetical protein
MGFTEKEIWRMTLRKFDKLWKAHCIFYGIKTGEGTIDDVIPEDVI